jgi:hypothetical protein
MGKNKAWVEFVIEISKSNISKSFQNKFGKPVPESGDLA